MRITEQEKLIAKVFDKSVEALGLMTKAICDSIKKDKQPTKREYLAGLAMQGLLANNLIIGHGSDEIQWVAKHAILQADELLKQLKATEIN